MVKKTYMSVMVCWPLIGDWRGVENRVEKLMEANGGERGDSGAGFGQRDVEWTFEDQERFDSALKLLEGLKIKGLEVHIGP